MVLRATTGRQKLLSSGTSRARTRLASMISSVFPPPLSSSLSDARDDEATARDERAAARERAARRMRSRISRAPRRCVALRRKKWRVCALKNGLVTSRCDYPNVCARYLVCSALSPPRRRRRVASNFSPTPRRFRRRAGKRWSSDRRASRTVSPWRLGYQPGDRQLDGFR